MGNMQGPNIWRALGKREIMFDSICKLASVIGFYINNVFCRINKKQMSDRLSELE